MTDKLVVLSTCESSDEAGRIARLLVEQRLAACVNIAGPITSVYRWKGAVEDAAEYILIIKTARSLLTALRRALESAHSYEVPELIALSIDGGSERYLDWLSGALQPGDDAPR